MDKLVLSITNRNRNAVDKGQFGLAPRHVTIIARQEKEQLL